MIEPSKLLIGSHGEILDMVIIPSPPCNQSTNTTATSTTNTTSVSRSISEEEKELLLPQFKLALITNSNQVRIVDERFTCSILEGHKDIVLSVDVSPDG